MARGSHFCCPARGGQPWWWWCRSRCPWSGGGVVVTLGGRGPKASAVMRAAAEASAGLSFHGGTGALWAPCIWGRVGGAARIDQLVSGAKVGRAHDSPRWWPRNVRLNRDPPRPSCSSSGKPGRRWHTSSTCWWRPSFFVVSLRVLSSHLHTTELISPFPTATTFSTFLPSTGPIHHLPTRNPFPATSHRSTGNRLRPPFRHVPAINRPGHRRHLRSFGLATGTCRPVYPQLTALDGHPCRPEARMFSHPSPPPS